MKLAALKTQLWSGRLKEAYLHQRAQPLGEDERHEFYFYLIVELLRAHKDKAAHAMLLESGIRAEASATSFYWHQIHAFRAYYRADYAMARRHVVVGISELQDTGSEAWLLAHDLKGHCEMQVGRIVEGFGDFDRALATALSREQGDFARMIRASLLGYRVRFGYLQGAEALAALDVLLQEGSWGQQSFTRLNLLFEKCRVLNFLGRWGESKTILADLQRDFYPAGFPKQRIEFLLIKSEIFFLEGALAESLECTLAARGELRRPRHFVATQFHESTQKLQLLTGSWSRTPVQQSLGSENLLASLVERAQRRDPETLETLLREGQFGLLQHYFPRRDVRDLWLGVDVARGALLTADYSGIHRATLPKGLIARLLLLFEGVETRSHASIVESLWGYVYAPDRHLGLVVSLLRRAEAAIPALRGQLSWDTQVVTLSGRLRILRLEVATSRVEQGSEGAALKSHAGEWNLRQERWISRTADWFSPGDYARAFGVARNTASRDLQQLLGAGLLECRGKGPARLYRSCGGPQVTQGEAAL